MGIALSLWQTLNFILVFISKSVASNQSKFNVINDDFLHDFPAQNLPCSFLVYRWNDHAKSHDIQK